jgi:mRNA interferase RelE/StbE
MNYKLRFHKLALKEWKKLDSDLQAQFKKKLAERLHNPHIPSAALSGMPNCYKIKLRKTGYRLIYRVDEQIVYVTVIAVGKRDRLSAYKTAKGRAG